MTKLIAVAGTATLRGTIERRASSEKNAAA
jgi:hypothetical protein